MTFVQYISQLICVPVCCQVDTADQTPPDRKEVCVDRFGYSHLHRLVLEFVQVIVEAWECIMSMSVLTTTNLSHWGWGLCVHSPVQGNRSVHALTRWSHTHMKIKHVTHRSSHGAGHARLSWIRWIPYLQLLLRDPYSV